MARKKTKKIPQNYMDTVMLRNPYYKWSENEEGIVVIDVINQGIHHRIAQKLLHKPKTSHISLDKYGSVLWKALDGRNTVYDILILCQIHFLMKKILCLTVLLHLCRPLSAIVLY